MEVKSVEMWASPSTLHLRILVAGKRGQWIKWCHYHLDLEDVPHDVRIALLEQSGTLSPPQDGVGLW